MGQKPRPRGGPYDDAVLGKRLDELRRSRDMKVERFCELMNEPEPGYDNLTKWDDGVYSRKHTGKTPIWGAEWGRIQKILDLPVGCPWIEESEARIVEAMRANPAVRTLLDELAKVKK